MYEIKQIEGEDILIRYNELKIEIDKALEHSDGEWTAAQIVEAAIKDPTMYHLWEILMDGSPVAIATTRIINYNNFTSLHIITLGGIDIYLDMPDLVTDFEEMVKEYEHIDYLEFTGRRGFIKQLNKVGWKEMYVTMRKNLKEIN
jgi:hypothetical protein